MECARGCTKEIVGQWLMGQEQLQSTSLSMGHFLTKKMGHLTQSIKYTEEKMQTPHDKEVI
ncbi:hypothetical protein SESBI_49838 [Sesbania bispinosa]|nr:hypothetical protein SESBI_49838 [Sesbania bispinosa]